MHSFVGQMLDLVATSLDALTALVVGGGLLAMAGQTLRAPRRFSAAALYHLRLTLGRWLALALELTLAADILQTVMVPTWDAIGKLAAIAALRTALNYTLQREFEQAEPETAAAAAATAS
jgi:uncharacterized membrane protein